MLKRIKTFWQSVRELSGDDAYERYLKHHVEFHAGSEESENINPLLSREDFFKQWQDHKWKGIKRCC